MKARLKSTLFGGLEGFSSGDTMLLMIVSYFYNPAYQPSSLAYRPLLLSPFHPCFPHHIACLSGLSWELFLDGWKLLPKKEWSILRSIISTMV